MSRRAGLALFLLMAVLFLIANRGAYRGFFQDDELDNISWAPHVPLSEFGKTLATPRYLPQNFRPVGHFYFHEMGRRFGLDFPKYVIPIHLLHLLNVWLVWLLARKLGASPFAASAGALFFAFHMAVFDVYWKPMYVFDLLCATFCLASLLLYAHGRWVLSFVAFWLAYKSKELAVMLPAVLACYEYWFGQKRWKPLVPFFAVSLSFGLQGLFLNRNHDNDYTFRFTPRALRTTSMFYAGRVFLAPLAGFLLVLVPLRWRDRRVWLGMAALLLFFLPLAFLPGRTFGAYCYLPFAGIALVLSSIADREHRVALVAFFLLWVPWNYAHLRLDRRQTLAIDDENRRYVTALRSFAQATPGMRTFVYDGRPYALNPWGIEGALKYLYQRTDLRVMSMDDPQSRAALEGNSVAVLSWDPAASSLTVVARRPDEPDASIIRMDRTTPLWQLEKGWYAQEGGFRWMEPVATARLFRPAAANQFELTVNINPDMIRDLGRIQVRALLNGQPAGSHEFVSPGWQTVRWNLPPAEAGPAQVEFQVQPPYRPSNQDPRNLGLAVGSFGFSTKEAL